jgi:hypothetical protein
MTMKDACERCTQVWQTRIADETGRLVAQVVQTQMVLTER